MTRFLPQTLFGRLFLATVAVIAATLLVIVLLILRERRELAFSESGSGAVVTEIAEASRHIAQLREPEREVALALLREEPIVIERPLRRLRRPPGDMAAARRSFQRAIQQSLGDDFEVRVIPSRDSTRDVIRFDTVRPNWESRDPRHNRPRELPRHFTVDVTVRLPDGMPLVFRAPAPRGAPPLPKLLFIQLGTLTLVLGAALFFVTRTITRPLADLAAAADAAGHGSTGQPVAVRGALEVRNATRAFNAMQERLSRYLDSRTRVLAAMSHDLRTPLTRLHLRAESIEDEALRERFTADLDEMTRMVNSALAMFRSLNDDEPAVTIDVNKLLSDLQREFAEAGHRIQIEGRAERGFVGRSLALKRCLNNLIGNAVRYGKDCCVQVADGPTALTLHVVDSGPGVPAEDLERVFEPFYRLEASRNRETGGAGLGLSIARDIAQAHGGTLSLGNRPTGGLKATLVLPHSAGP